MIRRNSKSLLLALALALCLLLALLLRPSLASAAAGACAAPAKDYGTVTETVSIPATGTYYIWSRIAADSTADNSYMLQIDTSNCFTVGSSSAKSVPVYASGATTHFANNSTNWLDTTTGAARISVSGLSAGNHTIKLIGNAPNMVIDRVIFTQDSTCTPTGVGDNCANPPDTTPPTVNITAPTDNTTLSGTVSATASASDDVGVTKVEFYVDGALKATDAAPPYTYSLNPANFSLGTHQLTAKAYDAANNSSTSSIVHFTVADSVPPTVNITAPGDGTTQSGLINVTGTASDNVGVTEVDLRVDNVFVGKDTGTSPYSIPWDTTTLANGTHTVLLRAHDAAGNTTDATVTVTVNNQSGTNDTTPPTISITTPAANAILNTDSASTPYNSKAYSVTVNATDASGIKQVVFKVDGVTKSTDTGGPFGFALDLSTLSCGSHTLTATATDNSANQNTATATATFTATYAADIAGATDCHVNFLDLSALSSKYGQTGSNLGRADINGDGSVDFLDLSAVSSKYGT